MPLQTPTFEEIYNGILARVRTEFPDLDLSLSISLVKVLAEAVAEALRNGYLKLETALDQAFHTTAVGEFLDRHAVGTGLTRLLATKSNGLGTATGVFGSNVPALTTLQGNNKIYETQFASTIQNHLFNVVSMTRVGATVTVETDVPHTFATGLEITISGADQTDYNGVRIATSFSDTKFNFQVTTTPTSPATGAITADSDYALLEIKSQKVGLDQNIGEGSLRFQIVPLDVDGTVLLTFGGIAGGSNTELDADLRDRITLAKRLGLLGLFTNTIIRAQAESQPNVTEVFVQNPELPTAPNGLLPGQARILFFVGDRETPSPLEIDNMRAALNAFQTPAHMCDCELFIEAPIKVPVEFDFAEITPDSSGMETSIINNLQQFFRERVDLGKDVQEIDYLCAINETLDLNAGKRLESFVLNSPLGDITVGPNEIASFGGATFP